MYEFRLVKKSGKPGDMSLNDLATFIEQTIKLVGQASQAITHHQRYNVLLLRDPERIDSSIHRQQSHQVYC